MHVFTYGSLMYEPVWRRVVSGEYAARAGTVRGYARRAIRGELYPALVRGTAESTVEGVLYLDVAAADPAALDRFEAEGEAYARICLPVELSDGRIFGAWSYLYLDSARLEDSAWDPGRFEREGLARFIATCCRDRAPG